MTHPRDIAHSDSFQDLPIFTLYLSFNRRHQQQTRISSFLTLSGLGLVLQLLLHRVPGLCPYPARGFSGSLKDGRRAVRHGSRGRRIR